MSDRVTRLRNKNKKLLAVRQEFIEQLTEVTRQRDQALAQLALLQKRDKTMIPDLYMLVRVWRERARSAGMRTRSANVLQMILDKHVL